MSERAIKEGRWISDVPAVVSYSVLIFLIMLFGLTFRPEASKSLAGPEGKSPSSPIATSTASPQRLALRAAFLVCGLCLFSLGVRSKAVLNNLPYERFSIASSDAHGDLDCNADQGNAER